MRAPDEYAGLIGISISVPDTHGGMEGGSRIPFPNFANFAVKIWFMSRKPQLAQFAEKPALAGNTVTGGDKVLRSQL